MLVRMLILNWRIVTNCVQWLYFQAIATRKTKHFCICHFLFYLWFCKYQAVWKSTTRKCLQTLITLSTASMQMQSYECMQQFFWSSLIIMRWNTKYSWHYIFLDLPNKEEKLGSKYLKQRNAVNSTSQSLL